MTAEEIISQLENDYLERLKWLICKEFRILPSSEETKNLTEEAVILCGAHMVLDKRMRKGGSDTEGAVNGSFDEQYFQMLAEGKS